jgi:hypothetical protein
MNTKKTRKSKTSDSFYGYTISVPTILAGFAVGMIGLGFVSGAFTHMLRVYNGDGYVVVFIPKAQDGAVVAGIDELNSLTQRLLTGTALSAAAASWMGTSTPSTVETAQKRKETLLQIIEQDPSAVVPYLISPEKRLAIPRAAAEYIETYATSEGGLEVVIDESFAEGKESFKRVYALSTTAGRKLLRFAKSEPAVSSGGRARISGYAIDDRLVVADPENEFMLTKKPVPVLEALAQKRLGAAVAVATTSMQFKSAVILFNFSDEQTRPFTPQQARQAVYTNASSSLNAFFGELSFGKVSVTGALRPDGDVFGWVTIPSRFNKPNACGDIFKWADEAQAAAKAQGYNAANYDQLILIQPPNSICTDGRGELGGFTADGLPTRLWMDGLDAVVLNHEAGHNLNLMHANLALCYDSSNRRVAYSNGCASGTEYGDIHDIMGYRVFRHINSFFKHKTNFINQKQVMTITKSGTYTLYPINKPTVSGVVAYRIQRSPTQQIYMEYRQPYGYDKYPVNHPVTKGISFRVFDSQPYGYYQTYLFDMTPGSKPTQPGYYTYTPDFEDGALGVGKTFSFKLSTGGTVRITPVSVGTSSAQIKVEM